MFFVIPEMPSKTFVMLYKKLPDHFKIDRIRRVYIGTYPTLKKMRVRPKQSTELKMRFGSAFGNPSHYTD